VLETKTAERKNATGIIFVGRAWISEADGTEKICLLDEGRADRG
jgi:hypothetical protein